MKNRKIFLLAVTAFLISSCGGGTNSSDSSSDSDASSSAIDTSSSSIIDEGSSSSIADEDSSSSIDEGGDEPTPPEPEKDEVTKVTINNNIGSFYVGETTDKLSAKVEGTGTYNKYVTFTVEDSSIIEVEKNQNHPQIKALKAGTTKLTATSNGDSSKTDSTTITVLPATVDSISLSLSGPLTLEKNKSVSLTATVNGKGDYTKNVTWSVSNDNVISFGTGNTINIKASHVGSTKLTAKADEVTASLDISVVADFDYSLKMKYDLVKKQEDLTLDTRYILVAKDTNKAMSPTINSEGDKFDPVEVTRNTADTNQIIDVVGNNVYTFLLKAGNKAGTYSLNYKDKYLQYGGNKNLKQVDTLDDSSSWTIAFSNNVAVITSCEDTSMFLRYNSQGSLFSAYSSSSANMAEIELYKYSSGMEQINFPYEEGNSLSTSLEYENSLIVHGFEPVSIKYESSDPTIAKIEGTNENFKITTENKEGEVTFTAKAYDENNTEVASTSVKLNVVSYKYTLNDSKYAISSDSNYLLDPESCKIATTYDIENTAIYFSFEKAYQGDNTYYISYDNSYLSKSSSQSRVVLGSEKAVWTVSLESDKYYVSTLISGATYYLQPQSSAIEGKNYIASTTKNPVDIIASPTACTNIEVTKSSNFKSTYNNDEKFDPTGLTVTATYSTSLGSRNQDVTSKVNWSNAFSDNSISGTVSILTEEKSVIVDGLIITHFVLDRLELNSNNAIKDYVVGDSVNISGVGIKAISKDSQTSEEKSITIDNSKVDYSPKTIAEDTKEITITYNDKSVSYTLDSVVKSNFKIEADHLHKGFHVVFGANVDGQNYEVLPDGIKSEKFNDIPRGKAVFEIEEVETTNVDERTYITYRFKLIEVQDETMNENIGKYLAYDGSDGKRMKLADLTSDTDGKTLFVYSKNVSGDGYSLLSKNLNKSLTLVDSTECPKFGLNGNYNVTIYLDNSIDYK